MTTSARTLLPLLLLCTACHRAPTPLVIPAGDRTMELLSEHAYVEPGLTPRERQELIDAQRTARAALVATFGTLAAEPLILFCHTAACKESHGAPPSAASSTQLGFARDGVQTATGFVTRPVVVVSGPFESTTRVLIHERVHVEMKAVVPYDALPTWFNEGIATYVANEPPCDAHPPVSDIAVRTLDTKQRWQEFIASRESHVAYCQSRHEVSTWATQFSSPRALGDELRALLGRIKAGDSFERAFRS